MPNVKEIIETPTSNTNGVTLNFLNGKNDNKAFIRTGESGRSYGSVHTMNAFVSGFDIRSLETILCDVPYVDAANGHESRDWVSATSSGVDGQV